MMLYFGKESRRDGYEKMKYGFRKETENERFSFTIIRILKEKRYLGQISEPLYSICPFLFISVFHSACFHLSGSLSYSLPFSLC